MIKKLFLFSIAALSVTLGVSGSLRNTNLQVEDRDTKIIVQLKNGADQNAFLKELGETITTSYTVDARLKASVNAIILDVNNERVEQIKGMSQVNHVDIDTIHSVTSNIGETVSIPVKKAPSVGYTVHDNASAVTMNKPDSSNEGEGIAIAILDTSTLLNHTAFAPLGSEVDVKYTEQGIQDLISAAPSFHGKNSGSHKTYYNSKIPFFYDYGGQSDTPGTVGEEDFDVFSTLSDHGNHVASIAAGNDITNDYYGIAPKAQILGMKVFTDFIPSAEYAAKGYTASTGAYDSAILKAMEDCAVLGVDIINMSLGSDLNDFDEDSLVIKMISTLRANGTFVNISAGNNGKGIFAQSGPIANWTTDMVETGTLSNHYGNVEDAMTVASGIPNFQFYENALMVGTNIVDYRDQIVDHETSSGSIVYKPNRPLLDITKGGQTDFGWVKIPGWGEEADYEGLDVDGKIAVVDRGETSFVAKITQAQNHHAVAMICINNDPSETDFTFYMDLQGWTPNIPVITILYKDRAKFTSQTEGMLSIKNNVFADSPDAKNSSDFTSDGATYNYNLKPDITTPGTNIYGAVYTDDNGSVIYTDPDSSIVKNDEYNYYSGTSMAAPNYCGAVALALSDMEEEDRATLNARMMSSADPMVENNGYEIKNLRSPRFQGAGMVNLTRTLENKIYLEGVAYGTQNGIGRAKICLFNSDEIAEGDLQLKFLSHSEETSAVTFTATTYVYRPDLVEMDAEQYPEFIGTKLQSINGHLIAKVENDVTINPGDNFVELPTYTIPQAEKAIIDDNFPYGCAIEGFVILTPKGEGHNQLSIPYLGFYGDYDEAIPVEPFDFARDNSKTYPSDLLNTFCRSVMGLQKADFSSQIAVGYVEDLEKFSLESMLLNETSLYNMSGFYPIGTNPLDKTVDSDSLYVGNNGKLNTMIIQQYVMRSVADNDITLKNLDTNQVVLHDHMFDSLYGEDGHYELYKSHIDVGYVSNHVIAHRAYSIIPMYDHESGQLYPDGHYEMKFEYQLSNGGTYTDVVYFTLDSVAPKFQSIQKVTIGTVVYYRVRLEEEKLSYLSVNGSKLIYGKDADGYYVDLPVDEYDSKICVNATDYAFGVGKFYIDVSDNNIIVIEHDKVAPNYVIDKSVTKWQNHSYTFDFSISQKGKEISLVDPTLYFAIGEDYDLTTLAVYTIKDGKATAVPFTIENGFIKVTTSSTTLRFVMGGDTPEGDPKPSSSSSIVPTSSVTSSSTTSSGSSKSGGGCGGSVTASFAAVGIAALTALGLALVKRKKQD